jgi:hypothetical protein
VAYGQPTRAEVHGGGSITSRSRHFTEQLVGMGKSAWLCAQLGAWRCPRHGKVSAQHQQISGMKAEHRVEGLNTKGQAQRLKERRTSCCALSVQNVEHMTGIHQTVEQTVPFTLAWLQEQVLGTKSGHNV